MGKKHFVYNFNRFTPIILFFLIGLIYIKNLSSSVYGVDSGELIAAALTKGVPHASGYPTYTILGILFTNLAINQTAAWKFGLVSALISALSIVFFYLTTYLLSKDRFISLMGSLVLAFTYAFWLYAEVVEIFSLHTLFVILLIYISIKYNFEKTNKNLYILSFLLGLSLTNNQTILLMYPSVALIVFISNPKIIINFKLLIKCLLFFLIGLMPYLYIPTAAHYNPAINFGNAVTFKNFIYHITRQTYGWDVTQNLNLDRSLSFKPFYYYWKIYVGNLIFPFALLGILYIIKKRFFTLLSFFLIALAFSGPVFLITSINAPVHSLMKVAVLERFFLQIIVVAVLLSSYGFLALKKIITHLLKNKALIGFTLFFYYIIIFVIPVTLFITNYKKTDLSNIYIPENLGMDVLGNLPENSYLLVQDDNTVFSSLYLQTAKNFRLDVYIPGRHEGMVKLLEYSGMDKDETVQYSVDHANTIGDQTIIYKSIIKALSEGADIYSDFSFTGINIAGEDEGKVIFVPLGLTNKLYFEKDFNLSLEEYKKIVEQNTKDYHLDDFEIHSDVVGDNLIYSSIKKTYAQSYFNISKFIFTNYNDKEAAYNYIEKAIILDPVIQK